MNANHIVNMIMRIFLQRILNFGIDRGVNAMGRVGRKRRGAARTPDHAAQQDGTDPAEELTPQDRRQQRRARQMARQARQMSRLTRRM